MSGTRLRLLVAFMLALGPCAALGPVSARLALAVLSATPAAADELGAQPSEVLGPSSQDGEGAAVQENSASPAPAAPHTSAARSAVAPARPGAPRTITIEAGSAQAGLKRAGSMGAGSTRAGAGSARAGLRARPVTGGGQAQENALRSASSPGAAATIGGHPGAQPSVAAGTRLSLSNLGLPVGSPARGLPIGLAVALAVATALLLALYAVAFRARQRLQPRG